MRASIGFTAAEFINKSNGQIPHQGKRFRISSITRLNYLSFQMACRAITQIGT